MSITTFTLWILCQCFLLFAWKACFKTDQTHHWISEGQMSLNTPFSFKLFFETNVHSSVFCSDELLYHFVSLYPLPMYIFVIDLPYKCFNTHTFLLSSEHSICVSFRFNLQQVLVATICWFHVQWKKQNDILLSLPQSRWWSSTLCMAVINFKYHFLFWKKVHLHYTSSFQKHYKLTH